jgi:hypothetical protein
MPTATALLSSYVVPKVWNYLPNLINVANASYGSNCYEITKEGKVTQRTSQLLSSATNTTSYTCSSQNIPITLLVELFLICSVRKISIQSDQFVPQHLIVQVSQTGRKNSFKTVKVIQNSMQKQKPFDIEILPPYLNVKFVKLIVKKGRVKKQSENSGIGSGSFTLKHIHVYGTPVISPENFTHIQKLDAVSSVIQKAKQGLQNLSFINNAQQQQQQQQPQSKTQTENDEDEQTDDEDEHSNNNTTRNTSNDIIFEDLDEQQPPSTSQTPLGSTHHDSDKISTASQNPKYAKILRHHHLNNKNKKQPLLQSRL